jgi:hypothetical protein
VLDRGRDFVEGVVAPEDQSVDADPSEKPRELFPNWALRIDPTFAESPFRERRAGRAARRSCSPRGALRTLLAFDLEERDERSAGMGNPARAHAGEQLAVDLLDARASGFSRSMPTLG